LTVTDDQPWYSPTYKPPTPATLQPRELLFTFSRGADRFRCVLRKQSEFGIEAQFFQNDEFFRSRRFDERKQALAWAESERAVIEHGPCPRCGGAGWLCQAHPGELADHDPRCAAGTVRFLSGGAGLANIRRNYFRMLPEPLP
jgi:hypothetical protein